MQRKKFIHSSLGKNTTVKSSQKKVSLSFNPYAGTWDYWKASHLLRRTTFGPTYQLIKQSVSLGLNNTINQLFQILPQPTPPVNYYYASDPDCAIGETWVDKPNTGGWSETQRNYSLTAWNFLLMMNEGMSIREKLTLFWINHFGVSNIPDSRAKYNYNVLLRDKAFGNFKQLIKDVTIEPAMLRFLNGDQNIKGYPNENYARELLELFTIGKGPQIGPGDYTHYTESDIFEMAKVLTGWYMIGFAGSGGLNYVTSAFSNTDHETGTKTLSSKFNNEVINNLGDQEYSYLIDIIFQKEEVSKHICRKLYRWFVYYEINQDIEDNIIEPMALILRTNNYEIKPALEALLKSEHFFDIQSIGPLIKSPIDYMISVLKQSHVTLPSNWQDKHHISLLMMDHLEDWQMQYHGPPSVAGWKAYYQSPLYYRMWINASSLQQRSKFVTRILGFGYQTSGIILTIKPLELITYIDNPYDPNSVIDEFAKIFFPVEIPQTQKDSLKQILLPGLPDFEWTVEYNDYVNNPSDIALAEAIEEKLENVLTVMYNLAECHLS